MPVAQQRRNLVAQRLAAAGRHQHERVAAGGDVFDDRLLLAAELRIAEDAAQQAERGLRIAGRSPVSGSNCAARPAVGYMLPPNFGKPNAPRSPNA